MLRSLALAAGLGTALTLPAAAQGALPICGAYPEAEAQVVCLCQQDRYLGTVWGSDPYTGDSDICAAAIHAGRLQPNGGAVQAFRAPGHDGYSGTSANGITSFNWASYRFSITFKAPAVNIVPAGGPACGRLPEAAVRHACSCAPAPGATGTAWGSGPYTYDSDICTAARHAGVIGAEGGPVTVLAIQGLDAYQASEWHGITTSSWSRSSTSIVFDQNGR